MSKMSKAVAGMQEANSLRLSETVTNFMGGDSYVVNPLDTLKMISASSIFGEPQYYVDGKFIFCSNAGDNSVGVFEINYDNGELKKRFVLPISGDYPKDIAVFPDNKHLISLNHQSGTMTFFNVDLEKNIIVMNGPEMKVKEGNTITLLEFE